MEIPKEILDEIKKINDGEILVIRVANEDE